MKIAVTLIFGEEVVWGNSKAFGASLRGDQRRPPCDVTPRVQFCGEFFESGETREMEVFDTYIFETRGGFNWTETCIHVVAEWEADKHNGAIWRWEGCGCTAHIWTGHDCGCQYMACSIFTPHELGVREKEEGSITTHQGVTIAWKRVNKEQEDETSTGRTDGHRCRDDDRVCLVE